MSYELNIPKINSIAAEKKILKELETEYKNHPAPHLAARERLNHTLREINDGNIFAKKFFKIWLKLNKIDASICWEPEPENFCPSFDGFLRTCEAVNYTNQNKKGGKK